jgi:hypothetical protein
MNVNSWMIAPLLIMIVLLLFSGCINSAPVDQVPQASTPVATVTPPTTTSQVTAAATVLPANPVPEETQVTVDAYVKQPFGFVKYVYNPAHKVRLLESHVETEPSGAQTIVGTIKNIGSERINLVTVTVNLLDADGNAIGSVGSEINYLDPNKVWKFRTTPFTMSDFRTHQVAEIFTG